MARYLAGEIDLDDIKAYFTLGAPMNDLKTIRKDPSTVVDSSTGLPLEPNRAGFRIANENPPIRRFDDTYGDRVKAQEVKDMMGVAGDVTEEDPTSNSRSFRDHDIESLTMSTLSSKRPQGPRTEPYRTAQQVQSLARAYDLDNLRENRTQTLPIDEYEERIVNEVEASTVTVIKGETGSGKTTRVPLMILNHWQRTKGRLPNIIVTQPRKIAAMSICRRVCDEQNWVPGKICGYQVSLERVASEDTCILYCTTGILLQKLILEKNLSAYSHIILDEVHDREADMDFCLLVIKQLLKTQAVSKQVRVVLMSATMDTGIFCDYFSFPVSRTANILEPASLLSVGGKPHEVNVYYAEEFHRQLGCHLPQSMKDDAKLTLETRQLALRLILSLDQREEKERNQERNRASDKWNKGSVLCFLPGLPEIESFNDDLQTSQTQNTKFQLIQLHSTITLSRQSAIFKKPEKGIRKVILSTNIAESSITVPDIKYVVDFCMTKRLHCDIESNLQHLKVEWTSKASADQRRGRAGRVDKGICYRLVSRAFFEECMDEQEVPEMQRTSLSQLVLKAKRLNLYPPKKLLSLAMDHPGLERIERAVVELKELDALTSQPEKSAKSYEATDLTESDLDPAFDGDLTFAGLVMADIPLDVHMTRLILMGHVFGFLYEAVIMACTLNQHSIFLREFDYRKQLMTFFFQINWSNQTESDLIASLNAYQCWKKKTTDNCFYDPSYERRWERDNGVDVRRLKDVDKQVQEVWRRLDRFNLHPSDASTSISMTTSSDPLSKRDFFLKLLIAGAFYPNYFVRVAGDESGDGLRHRQKEMSNRDPRTTVFLRGFDEALGPLYKERILEFFAKNLGPQVMKLFSLDVEFEGSKSFVEFRPRVPMDADQVLPPVLLSLKLEQIISGWRGGMRSNPINQYEKMTVEEAQKFLADVKRDARAGKYDDDEHLDLNYPTRRVKPPSPRRTIIPIRVTWVVSPERFWGIYSEDETRQLMQLFDIECNNPNVIHRPLVNVEPSTLCLGQWLDLNGEGDGKLYRAIILPRNNLNAREERSLIRVFFVDYGNEVELPPDCLFQIPDSIKFQPFQAMEFCLKGICADSYEGWPHRRVCEDQKSTVTDNVARLLEDKDVYVEIYSVVRGVLRCDVFPKQTPQSLNQELLRLGWAKFLAECSESEKNRAARQRHREVEERRNSYRERRDRDFALRSFYGMSDSYETESTSSLDLEEELSMAALRKIREAKRALDAMQRVEGNDAVNWEDQRNTGAGRYPCKNRPGLFQGPYSAFSYDFMPVTLSGPACGKVRIAEDSVNCVAVDARLEQRHQRLMVSAGVSLNSSGNTIRTRYTSIMPDVAGLPSLLALVFAPQAEFQTDKRKEEMLGARCGLGFYLDENGQRVPLYPDHDAELVFDVVIDDKDVRYINELRLLVHYSLDGDVVNETLGQTASVVKRKQEDVRERFLKLIYRPRSLAPTNKSIEWRPWGETEGLRISVPFGDGQLEAGLGVRLLSVISSDSAATTQSTAGPNSSSGRSAYRGRGRGHRSRESLNVGRNGNSSHGPYDAPSLRFDHSSARRGQNAPAPFLQNGFPRTNYHRQPQFAADAWNYR